MSCTNPILVRLAVAVLVSMEQGMQASGASAWMPAMPNEAMAAISAARGVVAIVEEGE